MIFGVPRKDPPIAQGTPSGGRKSSGLLTIMASLSMDRENTHIMIVKWPCRDLENLYSAQIATTIITGKVPLLLEVAMSSERKARMPFTGNFDSIFNVPGFDPEQGVKLKVITFSGEHDCRTPTSIVLTMRGNPGQGLSGLTFTLDILPPAMCKQCGKDLKGTVLGPDPQHGENPTM